MTLIELKNDIHHCRTQEKHISVEQGDSWPCPRGCQELMLSSGLVEGAKNSSINCE